MNNLCGFIGLFQPPLHGFKSTIYCVTTPDRRNLVMVPLVPNFFESAYSVAKDPKYQRIFMVLPSLDMQFVSDAYLFYYEISRLLDKQVEFFCCDKPQIPITDEFYSHVHVYATDKTFQFTEYLNDDEYFDIKLEYRTKNRPITRNAADIYLSINGKRVFLCEYMSEAKLKGLEESQEIDYMDEIHMPFMKNPYGGLTYIETKRKISPRYLQKLYAFGFASEAEAKFCTSGVGKIGEVIYDGLI